MRRTGEWARSVAIVACGMATFVAVRSAHAEPSSRIALDWSAPPDCPDAARVVARVEQLLGEQRTANERALGVNARVSRAVDGSYRADIATGEAGDDRSRSLHAPNCTELFEAVAVVIALAFWPRARAEEPASPVAPAENSEPTPTPKPASTPIRLERPPARQNVQPREREPAALELSAAAGAVLDFGTIAPVAVGVVLQPGLRYARAVELAVRATWLPTRSSSLPAQPAKGAEIGFRALGLLICRPLTGRQLSYSLCGELEGGLLSARGFGTDLRYPRRGYWLAPGLGAAATYPARSWLRARFSADALFPLVRTDFVVGDGVAHELPAVAPRLGIGLEVEP